MSESEKNVPKRRFKEFINAEAYEKRKLGDCCLIGDIDHRMPPSVLVGIPYVMTGDFIANNGIDFENAKRISEEDYEQLSLKIKPEKGDILFARYASIGTVRYVENSRKFLISYSCAILKPNKDIEGKYLYYYLQTGFAQQQIKLEINTGSQRNIGIDSLKNYIVISVPKIDEQVQVVAFLTNLDNLITLHEGKLEKMKALKKAYLMEMFPDEGEHKPKLRFTGFTDDWEQCKLGDVATIRTGYPFDSNNFDDKGEYLVITNVNIQNDSPTVDSSLGSRINFNNATLSEYVLNPNDILVTMDGTVGRTAKVVEQKQILAQRVGRLTAKSDAEFLYQFLNTGEFFKKMTLISHGGTIKHISLNEISSYISYMPSLSEEQNKIGAFFKSVDSLITIHQRKLEKLQNIKKAYLNEMFI